MRAFRVLCAAVILGVAPLSTRAFQQDSREAARRPLAPSDIDDIARLVMIEDRRQFDEQTLARILRSTHPEVRRRAALALGRIADARGGAVLASARADADAEVAATVVFATGQLRDPAAVSWLSDVLTSTKTPPVAAREAAIALGKIQAPEARAALARYLATARDSSTARPIVGEALLSIGRFTARADLGPIVRWTTAIDPEVRWRAAWALFRPRDPAAVPHLLTLSEDRSAEVRFWAVRGLAPPPPPGANAAAAPAAPAPAFDRVKTSARLRAAVGDRDRRVRTEALRALAQHDDDASFAVVLEHVDAPDAWLSVSAIESMGRFSSRAAVSVPRLIEASGVSKPLARRIAALAPLATLAPDAAIELADALARTSSATAKAAVRQALTRLGEKGRAKLDALTAEGALPPAPPPRAGGARGAPAGGRPDADYRRIVERWVVPDYNGAPKPRAIWETARGSFEIELYAGDAPLAMEHFVRVVESGEIVGTEFGRVVPDFVAQQRAIRDDVTLRDEVNRHGLTRGNLSWASAGLDTGRPGYTLGNTPQPHNEGNFTALGRVVAGMDVVDRIELGDKITAARMKQ